MARTTLGRPAKGLPRFFMDCGWHRHPRYAGLPAEALVTFQAIISYATEHATDGHAPGDVEDLAIAIGVRPSWVRKALPKLLDRGALERDGDEVVVPGWADHNPTRDEIEAYTDERSQAGSRGNHRRWHVQSGKWNPDCRWCLEEGPPPDDSDRSSDRSSDPTAIANPSHGMGWDRTTSRGCTDAAAGTAVAAANGQTPDQVLAAAVDLALDQLGHRTRAASKTNPTGWLHSAAAGVRADLIAADAWARIAQGATPADLVALIEPAGAPERPRATPLDSTQAAARARAEQTRARREGRTCQTCYGSPWCPPGGDAIERCPECGVDHRERLGVA